MKFLILTALISTSVFALTPYDKAVNAFENATLLKGITSLEKYNPPYAAANTRCVSSLNPLQVINGDFSIDIVSDPVMGKLAWLKIRVGHYSMHHVALNEGVGEDIGYSGAAGTLRIRYVWTSNHDGEFIFDWDRTGSLAVDVERTICWTY